MFPNHPNYKNSIFPKHLMGGSMLINIGVLSHFFILIKIKNCIPIYNVRTVYVHLASGQNAGDAFAVSLIECLCLG